MGTKFDDEIIVLHQLGLIYTPITNALSFTSITLIITITTLTFTTFTSTTFTSTLHSLTHFFRNFLYPLPNTITRKFLLKLVSKLVSNYLPSFTHNHFFNLLLHLFRNIPIPPSQDARHIGMVR